MELSRNDLDTIEKALRILRDRHSRHPSENSYAKNRLIFDKIEELRDRVRAEQSKQRELWVSNLAKLLEEKSN